MPPLSLPIEAAMPMPLDAAIAAAIVAAIVVAISMLLMSPLSLPFDDAMSTLLDAAIVAAIVVAIIGAMLMLFDASHCCCHIDVLCYQWMMPFDAACCLMMPPIIYGSPSTVRRIHSRWGGRCVRELPFVSNI